MSDFPRSLIEFQSRFLDEAATAGSSLSTASA
jgi:hypothetical protein